MTASPRWFLFNLIQMWIILLLSPILIRSNSWYLFLLFLYCFLWILFSSKSRLSHHDTLHLLQILLWLCILIKVAIFRCILLIVVLLLILWSVNICQSNFLTWQPLVYLHLWLLLNLLLIYTFELICPVHLLQRVIVIYWWY